MPVREEERQGTLQHQGDEHQRNKFICPLTSFVFFNEFPKKVYHKIL